MELHKSRKSYKNRNTSGFFGQNKEIVLSSDLLILPRLRLLVNSIDGYIKYSFFSPEIGLLIIIGKSNGNLHFIAGMRADKRFLKTFFIKIPFFISVAGTAAIVLCPFRPVC